MRKIGAREEIDEGVEKMGRGRGFNVPVERNAFFFNLKLSHCVIIEQNRSFGKPNFKPIFFSVLLTKPFAKINATPFVTVRLRTRRDPVQRRLIYVYNRSPFRPAGSMSTLAILAVSENDSNFISCQTSRQFEPRTIDSTSYRKHITL